MLKKSLYLATALISFAFVVPAHAEDVKQDTKNIQAEKRDISKDNADLRKDVQKRHEDRQELRKDVKAGDKALLCVDVWEHAYYIDYRNLRPKFVETWLNNLVNWDFAAKNYK